MLPIRAIAVMPRITPLPPPPLVPRVEEPMDPARLLLLPAAIRRPRNLIVLGGAVAMVLTTGILGFPVVASWLLGLGATAYSALVAVDLVSPAHASRVYGPLGPPLRAEVQPDEIDPPEVRALYRGILRAHERLRGVLSRSEVLAGSIGDLYRRCGELVHAAGRVARDAEGLRAHLDAQSADYLVQDADRLTAHAARTTDEPAAAAFRAAAQSRRQELATHREVEGLYDRVVARLSLVDAFLDSMTARAVKLSALEREAAELAAENVSEQLADLHGEFQALETSLAGVLTA